MYFCVTFFPLRRRLALPFTPLQILAQVYELANGKDGVAYYGMGGSIPIVALLKKYLGMETTMFGFALADDNMHAPNEFWREECLRRVE